MLALIMAAELAAAAAPTQLMLLCAGRGDRIVTDTANVFATNSGGDSAQATVLANGRRSFDGLVQVRINGERGTIRVPQQLLPPIRGSRDEDGAYRLSEIRVSERSITGRFSLNLFNKPKFVIDRSTGAIELSGFGGGFSGVCERVNDAPEARKF